MGVYKHTNRLIHALIGELITDSKNGVPNPALDFTITIDLINIINELDTQTDHLSM